MVGLLLLSYSLGRIWQNRLRLNQTIQLRQQETDQLRTLDALKDRFFANITHELRTPLTLILGPVEQIREHLNDPQKQDSNRHRLDVIDRNAHQLLVLVNQLLDLSKLEARALPIEETRGDLAQFVEQLLVSFEPQATAKALQFTFQSAGLATAYWFDADKLERIIGNLVANALKFTTYGSVSVELSEMAEGVQLTVSDTGRGIPVDQLPHIFERFYQVPPNGSTTGQISNPGGTGLGLALVNELIELQGGQIRVASTLGEGTTFRVRLPYRPAIPHSDEVPSAAGDRRSQDAPIVLIVDDSAEMRAFIASSLPQSYQIYQAADGADGWQQAVYLIPDLIISDVMMPVMNGYELTQTLKADIRTSHIPVLLLTAKAARNSRMKGLSQGADDYLTKPFSVAELRLRVQNQLEQRRRHRAWVHQQIRAREADSSGHGSEDVFLTRLFAQLDAHLEDTQFGIEQLADQLGLSRSQLHRKVRALTDMPPSELVRAHRLKRATAYLHQGNNSSETAFRVGFESPAYFARCFREQYGVSPSEYVQQR